MDSFHEIRFAFSSIALITAGILLILIVGVFIRSRWRLLFFSIISFFVTTLITIALLTPRGTSYHTMLAWARQINAGTWRNSDIAVSATNYGIRFDWQSYDDLRPWDFRGAFQISASVQSGVSTNYPSRPDQFSLIKSDFLRKTLGFEFSWWDGIDPMNQNDVHSHLLIVPQWFVLLFCPWFPLIWLRRHFRQRNRIKNGLCLKCGFDLRAHKPGEKCPSCGTLIPTPIVKLAADAQTLP